MYKLYEQFIYLQLKRSEEEFRDLNLTVLGQESKEFWQGKTIRQDIVLEYLVGEIQKKVILDIK